MVIESGLLISQCTITTPPGVFDAGGAPDPTAAYQPLSGHVNLPCMAAPLNDGSAVNPTEAKSLADILSKDMRHVLLNGYYPAITTDYRAVVDGVEYDVVGLESDSQRKMTRLALEKVSI